MKKWEGGYKRQRKSRDQGEGGYKRLIKTKDQGGGYEILRKTKMTKNCTKVERGGAIVRKLLGSNSYKVLEKVEGWVGGGDIDKRNQVRNTVGNHNKKFSFWIGSFRDIA